jgi:hypothetical protein
MGPQGPTGSFEVKYVVALSAPSIPNETTFAVTGYYLAVGPLASNFNLANGTFTSVTGGYYLVTINQTFQRIVNGAIQVDNGTRQVRIARPYLPLEPAFIGQSVWITLPDSPTGPFYSSFSAKLSAAGAFVIPAGGTINVISYQDNTNANTITAFTEFSITKLSNDPPVLADQILIGPIGNV